MKVTRTNGANNKMLEVFFKNKRTNKTNFLNKFPEGATLEWALRNLKTKPSRFPKTFRKNINNIFKKGGRGLLCLDIDNLTISRHEDLSWRVKKSAKSNDHLQVIIIY